MIDGMSTVARAVIHCLRRRLGDHGSRCRSGLWRALSVFPGSVLGVLHVAVETGPFVAVGAAGAGAVLDTEAFSRCQLFAVLVGSSSWYCNFVLFQCRQQYYEAVFRRGCVATQSGLNPTVFAAGGVESFRLSVGCWENSWKI